MNPFRTGKMTCFKSLFIEVNLYPFSAKSSEDPNNAKAEKENEHSEDYMNVINKCIKLCTAKYEQGTNFSNFEKKEKLFLTLKQNFFR